MISRRNFLKNLGLVTAGGLILPHVPKTLYFDMGRNLVKAENQWTHIILSTPTTGTVGGIDRSTKGFWRNQTFEWEETVGPVMFSEKEIFF